MRLYKYWPYFLNRYIFGTNLKLFYVYSSSLNKYVTGQDTLLMPDYLLIMISGKKKKKLN